MSVEFKDTQPARSWSSFDTLLLDMDGTLLDLAFDNYFWRELIPRCVAIRRDISEEQARDVADRLAAAMPHWWVQSGRLLV